MLIRSIYISETWDLREQFPMKASLKNNRLNSFETNTSSKSVKVIRSLQLQTDFQMYRTSFLRLRLNEWMAVQSSSIQIFSQELHLIKSNPMKVKTRRMASLLAKDPPYFLLKEDLTSLRNLILKNPQQTNSLQSEVQIPIHILL